MTLANGEPQLPYCCPQPIQSQLILIARASLMKRIPSRISQRLLNDHVDREEAPVSDGDNRRFIFRIANRCLRSSRLQSFTFNAIFQTV